MEEKNLANETIIAIDKRKKYLPAAHHVLKLMLQELALNAHPAKELNDITAEVNEFLSFINEAYGQDGRDFHDQTHPYIHLATKPMQVLLKTITSYPPAELSRLTAEDIKKILKIQDPSEWLWACAVYVAKAIHDEIYLGAKEADLPPLSRALLKAETGHAISLVDAEVQVINDALTLKETILSTKNIQSVFGFANNRKLTLVGPTAGLNEYLSALIGLNHVKELIGPKYTLFVAQAVAGTIPFKGPIDGLAYFDFLAQQLRTTIEEDPSLRAAFGNEDIEAFIIRSTLESCILSNLDVGDFGLPDYEAIHKGVPRVWRENGVNWNGTVSNLLAGLTPLPGLYGTILYDFKADFIHHMYKEVGAEEHAYFTQNARINLAKAGIEQTSAFVTLLVEMFFAKQEAQDNNNAVSVDQLEAQAISKLIHTQNSATLDALDVMDVKGETSITETMPVKAADISNSELINKLQRDVYRYMQADTLPSQQLAASFLKSVGYTELKKVEMFYNGLVKEKLPSEIVAERFRKELPEKAPALNALVQELNLTITSPVLKDLEQMSIQPVGQAKQAAQGVSRTGN